MIFQTNEFIQKEYALLISPPNRVGCENKKAVQISEIPILYQLILIFVLFQKIGHFKKKKRQI